MARGQFDAKKIAREYAHTISSVLHIDGVMLFGSSARGKTKEGSDIDLIVLSHDFARMPFLTRLQLLNSLRRGSALTVPMDILGFTPREFTALKKSESPNLRGVYRDAQRVRT